MLQQIHFLYHKYSLSSQNFRTVAACQKCFQTGSIALPKKKADRHRFSHSSTELACITSHESSRVVTFSLHVEGFGDLTAQLYMQESSFC